MEIKETGYFALLAGIVLAIIIGIIDSAKVVVVPAETFLVILAFIGLVVGILNLVTRDTVVFLIVTLVLALTAKVVALPIFGGLATVLNDITIVSAAAGFIVALKAIYALSFK